MAIFDWTLQTISRSDGRSAVAVAAYRAGAYLRDERTGLGHDFSRRRGLRAEIVLPPGVAMPDPIVPTWYQELRSRLWNAAELAERRVNSVTAREIVAALPHELDEPRREALGRSYARWLAERYRVAVDVAWHPPSASGDQRNHHLHMQFTTREVADGFTFGAKTRILDAAGTGGPEIAVMRAEWAAVANAALEAAGREERIDHRSLAARGIDREPGHHLGPMRTNMIRAILKHKAVLAAEIIEIDIEITRLRAEIAAAEEEERWERKQPRREPAPAVVIIDQRTLGPLGPYMAEAPTSNLAGVFAPIEPAAREAGVTSSAPPRKRRAAQPTPEPEPPPAGMPSPAATPATSPQEVRPRPSAVALEAAVGDAALAEVERLNRVHAGLISEKRKAEEEAEVGAKRVRQRGSTQFAAPRAAGMRPPPELGKVKRKRAASHADIDLPPLRAPVPRPDEEEKKPKRKLKVGPLASMGATSRTKGMAMAIGRATAKSRSRGRGGRGR